MLISISSMSRRRISPLFIIAALTWSLLPIASISAAVKHHGEVLAHPFKNITSVQRLHASSINAQDEPETIYYTPQQFRKAYGLQSILDKGFDGKGQTIVIIDSFGSPTAWSDLQTFDKKYGLPDPPSFQQLAPYGSVPFDPNNQDQIGWAEETSLDIQWSHAIAPAANILVLTSPIAETEGVQGFPEFLALERYAIHRNYKIISQSWVATENTLFTKEGKKVLDEFNHFYKDAVTGERVTFFASAGNSGTGNIDENGNIYPFPTAGFPASSPWTTSIGGTSLHADTQGNYQYETVWNEGTDDATGGGISQYYPIPDYQQDYLTTTDKATLKGHRGIPDIAMNADPFTGVPVYLGFFPKDQQDFYIFGGTSEGAPVWAGLLADATQYVGHPVSFFTQKIYRLAHHPEIYGKIFHDVTIGDNAQPDQTPPVPGYSAKPGWDLTTGWGSPIVSALFPALKSLSQ